MVQDRENIDLAAFSRRVREARLDQGLTQEDLAGRLDRSVEGTARLERGKTLPHPHTLRTLADELNTTVLWLLRGQGPKYPALVGVGEEKKVDPRQRTIDAAGAVESAHYIPDPEMRRKTLLLAVEAAEAFQAGEITSEEVVNRLEALRAEEGAAGNIASEESFGVPEVVNINVEVNLLDTFLRAVERGEMRSDEARDILVRAGTKTS